MPKEVVIDQSVNFDAIKIGLASPERIREWSRGEVKKPETINYRTLKPEREGLFCERIFGPSKDWECHCGKYKKIRYKGVICDRCGVEVTKSKVRRERMGHIELAAPVSHIWYFKGIPSRMGLILDISPRVLEKVLYFASYIVIDKGDTNLSYKQVLTEKEFREKYEEFGNSFRAAMGADAIREILQNIDLDKESVELKKALKDATGQKKARIIKRLEVVEAFRISGNRPEWMILEVVPVIPPDLRPMVQLDGGRFATSDLNDLYRRVINRNNRLARLKKLDAPEIIIRNEKRMLQEAVDSLIDNGRRGRAVTGPGNRPLKSLSDMLKGKQGRFRQNLLGKRVDYSGRSVIVVGPELKIYQCGLPKKMAIELFKPFIMKRLVEDGKAQNIKAAKKLVERLDNQVFDVLEEVISNHPVMLNRAPTLHRLGIQAFEPVLVEGKAIRLHPLVCTAYNADFDGDQMAVHLPLSVEAQAECRFLMLSPNNLLKPSDGGPVTVPSQDIVLGIYYLTIEKEGEIGEGKSFNSIGEAILAYENKAITLHAKVKLRRTKQVDGQTKQKFIETTVGRMILNEAIPQDLGFVDRSIEENDLLYEVNFLVGKKQLQQILHRCIDFHGSTKTSEVLDAIKELGFKYSTKGAITVSISDMEVPESKKEILEKAEKLVEDTMTKFKRGLLTEETKYKSVVDIWKKADEQISRELLDNLDEHNNIFMMADSGARGSDNQIKQLAGMRGLMADTRGRTIELPIKSNFREGLDVLEYFISAHGARKGLADTALRTADSGYLTRRLVDVSQDLIIREIDCCAGEEEVVGQVVKAFKDGNEMVESLEERITGRWSIDEILNPKTGKVIVKADTMITPSKARRIIEAGIEAVKIRTALTCKSEVGVCAKCYGADMATGLPVQVGESVGIIAAQSIGEPGTQLTMRTFHTGGIATDDDITQGLPRVQELFEARKPKGLAIIADFAGTVRINATKKKKEVVLTNQEEGNSKTYLIPYGSRLKVEDGQEIEAGDELTEGSVNPHDILKIKGRRAVQDYLLKEVQNVYKLQGVDINDKHIEVICRQMLKKIRIDEAGDTSFLPGSLVDKLEFDRINGQMEEDGLEPSVGTQVLLGITKASLATNSFLSAASFQETTKVLTEAAITGKVDPLIGLKENVILGKLIPSGTGMKRYRSVEIVKQNMVNAEADELKAKYEADFEAELYGEPMAEATEEVFMEDEANLDEIEFQPLDQEATEERKETEVEEK